MSNQNIKDLKSKFILEPIKRKRIKDLTTGKYYFIKVKDYTLYSRTLLINLFFNILQLPTPYTYQDKLPSLTEENLLKLNHPLAIDLVAFRKSDHILNSLHNASKYIKSSAEFEGINTKNSKGYIKWSLENDNNIERIFTEEGIPLNVDKRLRSALITPESTIPVSDLDEDTLSLLNQAK